MPERDVRTRGGSLRVIKFAILPLVVLAVVLSGYVGYEVYQSATQRAASIVRSTPTATATPTSSCINAYRATNAIVAENTCPGTADWGVDRPFGPDDAIEAYPAPASVNIGETVSLYVSTTAPSYSFAIYRIGWYQGLGGRLMYSSGELHGIKQPAPLRDPQTRMVSAENWREPVTVQIPVTWITGVYIVKLVSSDGFMRYTLFVVRNDNSYSPILFTSSILTYQAYNQWGGASLYDGIDAHGNLTYAARAYEVSFDRPYKDNGGLMDFVRYEYNTIRWLELSGYSVTYSTDVDTDLRPLMLGRSRVILFAGHDEYWSTTMRTNVTYARDHGVSLAFMGANDMYWHVRLAASPLGPDRRVICYKDASLDPIMQSAPWEATVHWYEWPVSQPQDTLLGEQYSGIVSDPAPLFLASGASTFLTGTALRPGSHLSGLIGGEYDSVDPSIIKTFKQFYILASSRVPCSVSPLCPNGIGTSNATLYVAASGAKVFDAGTFYWAWGLDDGVAVPGGVQPHSLKSHDFIVFTENIMRYLLLPPAK
jgi:hypothetical protein